MKSAYRINIFNQLNAFYSKVFASERKFTPHHISLYMFILNQNNRNKWVEWFKMPFDLAMAGACIGSKKTYYKILNDLQEWGFIKYNKGANEWKSPHVRIEVLKCTSAIPQSEAVEVHNSTSTYTSAVPQPTPQHTTLPTTLRVRDSNSITNNNITNNNITSNNADVAASPSQIIEDFKKEVDDKNQITDKKEKTPRKKPFVEKSIHIRCREFFMQQTEIKEIPYEWNGANGKHLNGLLKKIEKSFERNHKKIPTEEDVFIGFKFLIENLPEFYQNLAYNIPTFNSKFSDIYLQIRNSKNGKSNHQGRGYQPHTPEELSAAVRKATQGM